MKKLLLFSSFVFIQLSFYSQNYTWVKGSNTSGLPGTYGTPNTPAPTNNPGGRHGCGKWVDAAGNLWMFGGEGYSNSTTLCWMNDLWKYEISTNTWTWIRGSNAPNQFGAYGIQGVATATNEPGAREFPVCWTDASGNFWMFGGDGWDAINTFGRLSDLWKYNPSLNQWTWIKGFNLAMQNGIYGTQGSPALTSNPGGRYGAGTWKDAAGDFWMFGGRGFAAAGGQGYLNDLWRYNLASNQWTWMSGTNVTGQYGLYGTQSVPSVTNAPGARYFPSCWYDANGNLYLLGGLGFATSTVNYLNDLWKFNPTTLTWNWIGGSSAINATSTFGPQGNYSATTFPGARMASAAWKDNNGKFWMFGGQGYSSGYGELNELFMYDPLTNQWAWIKGSTAPNQNGTYGTLGAPAVPNTPGARTYNTWWKDLTGTFWLFGGEGFDAASTTADHMNDLWKFGIPCTADSIKVLPSKTVCSGASLTFTAMSQVPANIIWYNTPSSTASISAGTIFSTVPLTAISSPSVYSYYAESNSCTLSPRSAVSITVNPLPTISIAGPTLVCSGTLNSYTASGASTYTWSTGATGLTGTISSGVSGYTCTVLGNNSFGCENSVNFVISVLPAPSLSITSSHSLMCKGETATITASGAISYTWTGNITSASFTVNPAQTTSYTLIATGSNACEAKTTFTQSVKLCTGITELSNSELDWQLYPNPSQGNLSLFLNPSKIATRLVILNSLGQIVFEQNLLSTFTTINTNLAAGLYYAYVSGDGIKSATIKLKIEH